MKFQEERDAEFKLEVVEQAELASITGGVGPNFDVSKVEGMKLPGWLLPVPARLSILPLR